MFQNTASSRSVTLTGSRAVHKMMQLALLGALFLHAGTSLANDADAVGSTDDAKPSVAVVDPTLAAEKLGFFSGTPISAKRHIELIASSPDQVVAKHTSMLPVGPRGSSIPVETISVAAGRADAIVPPKAGAGVLLQSDSMVQAIATLGRVSMTVLADDVVVVVALEGDAFVGQAGTFRSLPEGKMRVFDTKKKTFVDRPLLGAPTVGGAPLGVALSGQAQVDISAQVVPQAKGYRGFLIDEQGNMAGPLVEGTEAHLTLSAPHAGNFSAFFRAVDEYGYAGAVSRPAKVQVLGLRPGQDVVRSDMVFLGPGERAAIVGHEGLVMRFGTSPEFIPASDSVGLPGRRATTVEFRDPTDPSRYAIFQLAPRLLKTKISIGPATSTWPKDPIEVKVTMWDGQGNTFNWQDNYRVVARVGLQEVDVDWSFERGVLRGNIAPQHDKGPWVVRVSLYDSQGEEVLRDFLEVAPTPEPEDLPTALDVAPPESQGQATAKR